MLKNRRNYIFLIFCLITHWSLSQEITPKGQFLKDSTRLGEVIPYSLSVKYPSSLNIIFPDSLYDFSPFEWVGKEIFPTKTQDNVSSDSAVYYLSTFELDEIQILSLPVFSIVKKDSQEIFSLIDSIFLQQVILEMPDSIAVKVDTQLLDIDLIFNYPYWSVGLILLTITIVLLIVIFGGSVVRAIRVWRVKKLYRKLEKQLRKYGTENNLSEDDLKQVLLVWKKYMEKMTSKPYLKLSTKEIAGLGIPENTLESLKKADKWLYGNQAPENTEAILTSLIQGAANALNEKIELINAQ